MSSSQLQIFSPSLPGMGTAYRMTETGLVWLTESPSREEFDAADSVSQWINKVDAWTRGALIRMYVRQCQGDNPSAGVKGLIMDYAQGRGLNYDVCYEQYCVEQFYPHHHRFTDLHWSLHRIVWANKGMTLATALGWLGRCRAMRWTADQLRAELRRTGAPSPPSPNLPSFFPPELQRSEDWCAGQLKAIDDMAPDHAAKLLACMECTVLFVDSLRARAGAAAAATGPS